MAESKFWKIEVSGADGTGEPEEDLKRLFNQGEAFTRSKVFSLGTAQTVCFISTSGRTRGHRRRHDGGGVAPLLFKPRERAVVF